jgi:hypothetical protein
MAQTDKKGILYAKINESLLEGLKGFLEQTAPMNTKPVVAHHIEWLLIKDAHTNGWLPENYPLSDKQKTALGIPTEDETPKLTATSE